MSIDGENSIGEALDDLQSNIQRKRNALEVMDFVYNKICLKCESNLKAVRDSASRIYNLESYLTSVECRLVEYDKKEKDREEGFSALLKSVEELQKALDEENNLAEADDIAFDEEIIKLIEERRQVRDNSGRGTGGKMENLHNTQNEILQETSDIKQALKEIKEKHPFIPSQDVLFILENANLENFISPEIKYLEDIKSSKLGVLNEAKKIISLMENEINQLSAQSK